MNDPAVGVTVARHAPQPKLHSEKAHSVIPQNKVPRTQRPPDRHALNEGSENGRHLDGCFIAAARIDLLAECKGAITKQKPQSGQALVTQAGLDRPSSGGVARWRPDRKARRRQHAARGVKREPASPTGKAKCQPPAPGVASLSGFAARGERAFAHGKPLIVFGNIERFGKQGGRNDKTGAIAFDAGHG